MVTWDVWESMLDLMRDLVNAKVETALTDADIRKIEQLIARVENRIVELVEQETDEAAGSWRSDRSTPRELRWQRDELRIYANDALTGKLRHAFRTAANRIQAVLNQGSEESAERLLSGAENSLAYAVELLNSMSEPNETDLGAADANIDRTTRFLDDLEKVPHIKHVGLPRVAKKRHTSVNALVNGLQERVQAVRLFLASSHNMAQEKAEQAQQQKRAIEVQRHRESQAQKIQLSQVQCAEEIERIVRSIEGRNNQAGKAARQFLENVKLKNVGAAGRCLNDIRRHDGGIPPILQEEYKRILRAS
jgi:hypothetical protein